MEKIKVSNPTEVGSRLKEMINFWQEKLGEFTFKPLVVLHPIFFTEQCSKR